MTSDARRNMVDLNVEQESIRELAQRKNNLELELKNYAENQAVQVRKLYNLRFHETYYRTFFRNSAAVPWPDRC